MNNCIFIGRLTADPEIRVMQSGIPVARFTIAVDRRYKKDGEKTADFFRIEAWRGTAEFAGKYFHKGMRVAAQGEMQAGSYTDKEGIKRTAYTLNAHSLEFADGKRDGGNAGAAPGSQEAFEDGFMAVPDFVDEGLPFA